MGMFSVLETSIAGMDVQQARLAVAASNLANTSTTHRADGTAYVPLEVAIHSVLDPGTGLPRPQVGPTVESSAAPTLQYEPGDPAADSRGFVHRAGNDPVGAIYLSVKPTLFHIHHTPHPVGKDSMNQLGTHLLFQLFE